MIAVPYHTLMRHRFTIYTHSQHDNKNMRKLLSLLFILLLISTACSTDEARSTFVNIQLLDRDTLQAGTYCPYRVACITEEGELANVDVTIFAGEWGHSTILDMPISGTTWSQEFDFKVPVTALDTTTMRLVAHVQTTTGASDTREKKIVVVATDRLLSEQGGLVLYSQEGDLHPNALTFVTATQGASAKLIQASLADEEDIDILFPRLEEGEDCARQLVSPNRRIEFVRNNAFNYGAATSRGVMAAYSTAITSPSVSGLSDDDTILFGTAGKAIGVIKIQKVYDEAGVGADRIYFSLKMI